MIYVKKRSVVELAPAVGQFLGRSFYDRGS